MPIYDDLEFGKFVRDLPAASEADLAAGNKMPLVRSGDVKGLPGDTVAKDSDVNNKAPQKELNELYEPEKNLVTRFIDGVYPGVSGGKLSLVANGYGTIEIELRLGQTQFVCNVLGSMNFSRVYDSEKNFIGMLRDYDNGNSFVVPANAKYIYTASSSWYGNCPDIVVLEGLHDMSGKSVADYPFGELKKVKIEKLWSEKHHKFVEDFVLDGANYEKVSDGEKNVIKKLKNWIKTPMTSDYVTLSLKSEISGTMVVNRQFNGFRIIFVAESDKVYIRLKGTHSGARASAFLQILDSSYTQLSYEIIKDGIEDTFDIEYSFSADYYKVYENAVYFAFWVHCVGEDASTNNCVVNVENCFIRDCDDLQKGEDYDPNLRRMLANMEVSIAEAKRGRDTPSSFDGFMMGGDGHRYKLGVDFQGNVFSAPTIPRKVKFIGNSVLLGMDGNNQKGGAFGMCATSPYKDYAYLVEMAILEKNPSCIFSKIHGADFETSETNAAAESYWTDNQSEFDTDLDLVIVQLGDNVNTETRQSVFAENYGKSLIAKIKQKCTKARIICVVGWFNPLKSQITVRDACAKYDCDYVSIYSLSTDPANKGQEGQTTTYYNGETIVTPSGYLSHPGDNGMRLIADRIIEKMNMG